MVNSRKRRLHLYLVQPGICPVEFPLSKIKGQAVGHVYVLRDQILPAEAGVVCTLNGRVPSVPVGPVHHALTHVQVDSPGFVLLAKLHHQFTAVSPSSNLSKVRIEAL